MTGQDAVILITNYDLDNFLESYKNSNVDINSNIYVQLIKKGHIDLFAEMVQRYPNVELTLKVFQQLIIKNHFKLIVELIQQLKQSVHNNFHKYVVCRDSIQSNNLEMVKYLHVNIFNDIFGNPEIHNCQILTETTSALFKTGNMQIFKYLLDNGFKPSVGFLIKLYNYNRTEMFDFLFELLKPDEICIDFSYEMAKINNLEKLKQMIEKGCRYDNRCIKLAKKRGYKEMEEYLNEIEKSGNKPCVYAPRGSWGKTYLYPFPKRTKLQKLFATDTPTNPYDYHNPPKRTLLERILGLNKPSGEGI